MSSSVNTGVRKPAAITLRRAWILVGFMCFAFFLDNVDRHAVFSIFPVLKSRLHFTNVQLGLSGAFFLWVYAICSPIAGQIGDLFPKRTLVALSLFLWSGVTALTGFSRSVWMLLACRALLGITESLFMPAATALLASAHGPQTRSLAMNVFGLGEYIGVAAAGSYSSYVAQEFDWRLVFYSLGLFGMIYVVPYAAFLRGVHVAPPAKTNKPGNRLSVTLLAKVPSYYCLCVAFAIFACILWLMYTWFPTFLFEKFSLSLAQAGFTATVYLQSANLVGSLTGAALADRLFRLTRSSRFWVCCAGFLLAAPCFYLVGNSPTLSLTKVAAVALGLSTGMIGSNLLVAAFDVVSPDTWASACGFFNLVGLTSSGFAAVLEGKWKGSVGIADMMSYAGLGSMSGALLLLLCVLFFFRRDYGRLNGPTAVPLISP